MTVSEPGEMSVLEENLVPLKTKPPGKFDMHMHTSKLSQVALDDLILEYGIPGDLNPVLPPEGMTMEDLPEDKI